jgi:hypothetical protein
MPVKFNPAPQDPAAVIKMVQEAARKEGRAERSADMSEVLRLLGEINSLVSKMVEADAIGSLEKKASRRKRTKQAPLRPGTDQAKVLDIVRANPGLKGSEIAQRLPLAEERTIRTSLRRLKLKRGLIEQRDDGCWYPTEGTK